MRGLWYCSHASVGGETTAVTPQFAAGGTVREPLFVWHLKWTVLFCSPFSRGCPQTPLGPPVLKWQKELHEQDVRLPNLHMQGETVFYTRRLAQNVDG